MPRASVMSHNPFEYANGKLVTRERVPATFELRARLRNEIEELDKLIVNACRDQKSALIDALTRARAEKAEELDSLRP